MTAVPLSRVVLLLLSLNDDEKSRTRELVIYAFKMTRFKVPAYEKSYFKLFINIPNKRKTFFEIQETTLYFFIFKIQINIKFETFTTWKLNYKELSSLAKYWQLKNAICACEWARSDGPRPKLPTSISHCRIR